MSDEAKPTKVDRLKFYGLLAGMITALVGTLGTYLESRNETIARDSYKVTIALVARLSDESQQNHKDILALREYLDKHVTGTATPAASSAVLADAGPPAASAVPLPSVVVTPAPPPPTMSVRPAAVKVSKSKSPSPPSALVVFDKDGNKSTITVPDEWP